MSTVYYPAKGDTVQVNGIRVGLNGFDPPEHMRGLFLNALKMGIVTTTRPVMKSRIKEFVPEETKTEESTIKISLKDASDITASNSNISMEDYGLIEDKLGPNEVLTTATVKQEVPAPQESKYNHVTRKELIEIALERKIQNPYKISTDNLVKILEDQDLGLI